MPETYLLPQEAAAYLRVAVKTLTQWRWRGVGPPYLKVAGGRILYTQDALDLWMAGQCVWGSTGPAPLLPAPPPRAAVPALPPRRRRGSRCPR